MKGAPIFIAMQAEGREWTQMFSRSAASLFDYVFTDSMTWTDNRGKRMRTWIPQEVGTIADPQEFMETLVDRAVGILDREPVDIYVNPTYLPDVLQKDYESLWTETRRKKVIAAAGEERRGDGNQRSLQAAQRVVYPNGQGGGVKFTFGTNNTSADDLRRCDYGLQMVQDCKLVWQDFFVPGKGPKAIERKGSALKS